MTFPVREGSCLHLVVQSSPRALDNCLAQFDEGDAVLLLDDGVMHLVGDDRQALPTACYFSGVDLEARGLSGYAEAAGAVALADMEIIDMLHHHAFCLTWK